MLALLTDLVGECGQTKIIKQKSTKNKPFYWSPNYQSAFDSNKKTIACDVNLDFPDFTKAFEIYTDVSSKQLGSIITQDNRHIMFFRRKLTETQQKILSQNWNCFPLYRH